MTFGEKLNKMRKSADLTQEDVANRLGVSPQAVSKWENDLSCPDIMLLPKIAELYSITVDGLLDGNEPEKPIKTEPEIKAISLKNDSDRDNNSSSKFLKVNVITQNGDTVDVKLPLSLIKTLKNFLGTVKLDKSLTGGVGLDLSEIDFDEIFELVDNGVMGKIVSVVTQNGDTVDVYVE